MASGKELKFKERIEETKADIAGIAETKLTKEIRAWWRCEDLRRLVEGKKQEFREDKSAKKKKEKAISER